MLKIGIPAVVFVVAAMALCKGLFWLGVVVIVTLFSVATNHAKPDPKTPAAAVVNCFWKLLKLPYEASMAFLRSLLAAVSNCDSGVSAGARCLKKKA